MFFELVLAFASYSVFSDAKICQAMLDLYCNMGDLEQRLTKLESKAATRVAYLATGVDIHGDNLTFPNVLMNDGDGYDRWTGYFRAPVAGRFYISTTLSIALEKEFQRVQCFVHKNGNIQQELFADHFGNNEVGLYQVTLSMPLDLEMGDDVNVGACTYNSGIYSDAGTSFSGVLLSQF